MDSIVHEVAKSQTRLSDFHLHRKNEHILLKNVNVNSLLYLYPL